jgi:hypothetical protein
MRVQGRSGPVARKSCAQGPVRGVVGKPVWGGRRRGCPCGAAVAGPGGGARAGPAVLGDGMHTAGRTGRSAPGGGAAHGAAGGSGRRPPAGAGPARRPPVGMRLPGRASCVRPASYPGRGRRGGRAACASGTSGRVPGFRLSGGGHRPVSAGGGRGRGGSFRAGGTDRAGGGAPSTCRAARYGRETCGSGRAAGPPARKAAAARRDARPPGPRPPRYGRRGRPERTPRGCRSSP